MLTFSFLGSCLLNGALITALLQGLLPTLGYFRHQRALLALAKPAALVQAFWVANAFFLLSAAFIANDFTVSYVAKNSHPTLPFFYRLTAVWGAHEGSFLLWIFLLNLWTVALCFLNTACNRTLQALSLSLLGWFSFFFLLFLKQTSNPFLSGPQALPQDLNPLLQDPGFFFHPPFLYAGYVGFSVAFALTVAYLLQTGLHPLKVWAKLVRPWVLAAWSFLTLGISLGSFWAYHVLGWGGFWFWDPVENASLLPWLAGAALLHVLIICEKQNRLGGFALLLSLLTFSLSILGTFLVRSGVLISVHSFASDPSRGLFLLLLLALIMGSALLLYLYRTLTHRNPNPPARLSLSSSRALLLSLQSFLLFSAMATVLLGTLYPLIFEAFGWGALSVGPPYFNQVLYPLLLVCLVLMGLAPQSSWSSTLTMDYKTQGPLLLRRALYALITATILVVFFTGTLNRLVIFELSLIFWVLFSLKPLALNQLNLALAHGGFALMVLSLFLSSAYSSERFVHLKVGEQVELGPYQVAFKTIEPLVGPNFKGAQAQFQLFQNGRLVTTLRPEKRLYPIRGMALSKVAIYPAISHDFYMALGEPLADEAWSLRLYYKPFIRFLWLGGLCLALSGFLTVLTLRRRRA